MTDREVELAMAREVEWMRRQGLAPAEKRPVTTGIVTGTRVVLLVLPRG